MTFGSFKSILPALALIVASGCAVAFVDVELLNGDWALSEVAGGNANGTSSLSTTPLAEAESLILKFSGKDNSGRILGESELKFPGHEFFFASNGEFLWNYEVDGKFLVVRDFQMSERRFEIDELTKNFMVLIYRPDPKGPGIRFVFRKNGVADVKTEETES
jgi:hypothetical protein